MQIVYISSRPSILLETLGHASALMPFLSRALVCAPDHCCDQLKSANIDIPVDVVPESVILSADELTNLPTMDHQSRNYLLRCRLMQNDAIEDCVVMSDDDARPLRPLSLDVFRHKQKYRAYYFHSLAQWNNHQTDFDAGQHFTFATLNAMGYSTHAFASHMPQIVDKALFLEANNMFNNSNTHKPLCEWSSYFNYGMSVHPDRFAPPTPYVSLCWPEHPLAWRPAFAPEQFIFENFTPELYNNGNVFGGLPTEFQSEAVTQELTIEKVARWRRYEILSRHPEQARGLTKFLNWRTWVNKLTNHR